MRVLSTIQIAPVGCIQSVGIVPQRRRHEQAFPLNITRAMKNRHNVGAQYGVVSTAGAGLLEDTCLWSGRGAALLLPDGPKCTQPHAQGLLPRFFADVFAYIQTCVVSFRRLHPNRARVDPWNWVFRFGAFSKTFFTTVWLTTESDSDKEHTPARKSHVARTPNLSTSRNTGGSGNEPPGEDKSDSDDAHTVEPVLTSAVITTPLNTVLTLEVPSQQQEDRSNNPEVHTGAQPGTQEIVMDTVAHAAIQRAKKLYAAGLLSEQEYQDLVAQQAPTHQNQLTVLSHPQTEVTPAIPGVSSQTNTPEHPVLGKSHLERNRERERIERLYANALISGEEFQTLIADYATPDGESGSTHHIHDSKQPTSESLFGGHKPTEETQNIDIHRTEQSADSALESRNRAKSRIEMLYANGLIDENEYHSLMDDYNAT